MLGTAQSPWSCLCCFSPLAAEGDFWIDQTEVTNAQYRLCLEAGVCQDGVVSVSVAEGGAGPGASLCFSPEAVSEDIEGCVATIRRQVGQRGGIQPC